MNDLDVGGLFIPGFLLTPYNLILLGIYVWTDYGKLTIVLLLLQIFFLISTKKISNLTKKYRTIKNTVTDTRIKYSNELIECIRLIKLYAWEKPFLKIITALRDKEYLASYNLMKVDGLGRPVSDASVPISMFIISILYIYYGGILSVKKIYFVSSILLFLRVCVIF